MRLLLVLVLASAALAASAQSFIPVRHHELVGFSTAVSPVSGATGRFGVNRACAAEFPGSRICTPDEVRYSSDPPSVPGPPGAGAWLDVPGENCDEWTNTTDSGNVISLLVEPGVIGPLPPGPEPGDSCCAPRPIACCALPPPDIGSGDVNGDTAVDLVDAVALRRYLAGEVG